MAPGRDIRDERVGPQGRPTPDAVLLDRFLADSHIFSATVREILGAACLEEASDLPLTLAQLRLLKVLTIDGRRNVSEVAGLLAATIARLCEGQVREIQDARVAGPGRARPPSRARVGMSG